MGDDGDDGVAAEGSASVHGAELRWAGATDVGRVRALNEDAWFARSPVYVVADGMGGHEAGEIASALVVSRLHTLVDGGTFPPDAVAAELSAINDSLRVASNDEERPMGTTVVGLVLFVADGDPRWLVFGVGDSRVYSYSEADDRLVRVSHDHSYVQELIDAGEISEPEARVHPHRSVVTRALGIDEVVEPDFWVRPVRPGERFLLCSDGLTGEVEDDEIATVLAAGQTPAATVETLVGSAVERGGRDNVTVIVVDVVSVEGWHDSTTDTRPGAADGPEQPTPAAPSEVDTVPPLAPPAVVSPPAATSATASLIDDVPVAAADEAADGDGPQPGGDEVIDGVPEGLGPAPGTADAAAPPEGRAGPSITEMPFDLT